MKVSPYEIWLSGKKRDTLVGDFELTDRTALLHAVETIIRKGDIESVL
jgi:hypothetical protein